MAHKPCHLQRGWELAHRGWGLIVGAGRGSDFLGHQGSLALLGAVGFYTVEVSAAGLTHSLLTKKGRDFHVRTYCEGKRGRVPPVSLDWHS